MAAVIRLLPGALDLQVYRGDDPLFQVTMTEGGTPVVLPTTGWTAQIRESTSPTSPVLATFTIDASTAATGVLRLSLAGADTAGLPSSAAWDLQCTDGGKVRTYLAGSVVATGQVTR